VGLYLHFLLSGFLRTLKATIVFDTNEPIETPTWVNTIDATTFLHINLSSYSSYLRWLNNLCPQQKAVVLVVVGDDNATLLLAGQYKLNIILYVDSRLTKCCINVLHREINDGKAVLKLTNYGTYLLICLALLIDGDKLRHAEARDVESLAHDGVEVVQAVIVCLVSRFTAIGTNKNVGIYKYVVGIICLDLSCHACHSKYQVRKLLLLLSSEQVDVASHPHAYLSVYKFLILQSSLLQKQLQHGLALLFHLFLFLTHNAIF